MNLQEAKTKLARYNQGHVLKDFDKLSDNDKEALLKQIDETDFSVTDSIINKKDTTQRGVISPIKAMTLNEIEENRDEYTETGLETIREGKVGAVLLAGGMGTRLGSDNPKGMFDIGIT